jgi:hypothetical protein
VFVVLGRLRMMLRSLLMMIGARMCCHKSLNS